MELTFGLIGIVAGALVGLSTAMVTSYINKLDTQALEDKRNREALTVEVIETIALFYNYRKFYVASDNWLCLTTGKLSHNWRKLSDPGLSATEKDDLVREEKLLDKERDGHSKSVDSYFEKLLVCESKFYGQLIRIQRHYNLVTYTELATILMEVINEGNTAHRFGNYDTIEPDTFLTEVGLHDSRHNLAMEVIQTRCNTMIRDIKPKLN